MTGRSVGKEAQRAVAGCCPTCDLATPRDAGTSPFCSIRCKMVDLGRWFNEEYAVPGEDAVTLGGQDLTDDEDDR